MSALPCGRELLVLAEQAADGAPPAEPAHQRDCPHCQAALARLAGLDEGLRDLAGEEVRPPRGLRDRVLDQVRRERDRNWFALEDPGPGASRVSNLVLGQLAWRAAVSLPGVRLASVSVEPHDAGGVAVEVHVTAALGPPLPELAEALRELVTAHLWALSRQHASRVDVVVDDVA